MKSKYIIALAVVALSAALLVFGPDAAPLAHVTANMTPDQLGAAGLSFAAMGNVDEIKAALGQSESAVRKIADEVKGYTEKAQEEVKRLGTITAETSGKLGELMPKVIAASEATAELKQRVLTLEQAGLLRGKPEAGEKSAGDIVIESEEYKDCKTRVERNDRPDMHSVKVGSFHKTAIVNATGQNQPLVPADRQGGIIMPGLRRLTIRDLLPVIRTGSNLIEYAKENAFTNNAGPQYSSPNHENVAKNESALTFTLDSQAVRTIAHWIPASRQVLSDAPQLAGYINTRLSYGLKLEEEDQLLNGDNAGGNLNGLVTQATAFTESVSVNGDTILDTILRAMKQCADSEFPATGIVLNPTEWYSTLLLKDNNGNYIFGDPSGTTAPTMWGLPVVPTNSMTAGSFLVGSFALAASIFDREDATVRVAEQHSDFFVKNMVAILAEERLSLVVWRPTALITGTFES